jgi:hypothetical protein
VGIASVGALDDVPHASNARGYLSNDVPPVIGRGSLRRCPPR